MKKRLKGQKIYKISYFDLHSRDDDSSIHLMRVVERIVEASGPKTTTFFDRGYDMVYGRQIRSDHPRLFASREEAFAYLESLTEPIVIDYGIYDDETWIPAEKNWWEKYEEN